MFKESKDRSLIFNICAVVFCFLGMFLVPSFFYTILYKVFETSNETVLTIYEVISNFMFILVLFLLYMKDLMREFSNFISNFKKNMKTGFKYYFVGYLAMIFFNLIIAKVMGDVSSNENQVRDLLFTYPLITMISLSIIAPLNEELIFRKSLSTIIKNKYVFAVCSGLLFGGAHLLTNVLSGSFVISDLIYLLPYSSLGVSFAIMNYETDSTFTSIFMHCIHNTCTGLLLLMVASMGAI